MAIFKDSGENAEIFQKRDKMLDETGILNYEKEFGKERAIGYMEATRDFNHQLKCILGAGYTHVGVPKTGVKMRNKIKALFHENDDLIDYFVKKHAGFNNTPSI